MTYPCIVLGCEKPAEPWDGPFCGQHEWSDYHDAIHVNDPE